MGNKSYLLDGYIFAALFEKKNISLLLLIKFAGVDNDKRTLHSGIFVNGIFLSCRVTAFRGHKVAKHAGRRGISFLFID